MYFMDRVRRSPGLWVSTLRFLLRLINLLLALVGLAMVAYTGYMFDKFKHTEFPPSTEYLAVAAPSAQPRKAGFPWFIAAFGAAGLLTFITATCGLFGVSWNSRPCLGIYSLLLGVMLIMQAVLAVAFFADESWKKRLPHDDTGQAEAMEKFIRHRLVVCKWVGLGALIIQVFSMLLAFQLSAEQLRQLEELSDEEDDVWGRRRPLLSRTSLSGQSSGQAASLSGERTAAAQRRQDPWSVRMRDKYGLDTAQFTYSPDADAQSALDAAPTAPQSEQRTRCTIM